jgi:hypothetical protein
MVGLKNGVSKQLLGRQHSLRLIQRKRQKPHLAWHDTAQRTGDKLVNSFIFQRWSSSTHLRNMVKHVCRICRDTFSSFTSRLLFGGGDERDFGETKEREWVRLGWRHGPSAYGTLYLIKLNISQNVAGALRYIDPTSEVFLKF